MDRSRKLTITCDLTIAQPIDGTQGLISIRDIAVDRSERAFVLDWNMSTRPYDRARAVEDGITLALSRAPQRQPSTHGKRAGSSAC